MRILALDIGRKRTGVALFDPAIAFPYPLETIHAEDVRGLVGRVSALVRERGIGTIVVGLPLLLSGRRGAQAERVLSIASRLRERTGVPVETLDERYTTPRHAKHGARIGGKGRRKSDRDAAAACSLLQAFLR